MPAIQSIDNPTPISGDFDRNHGPNFSYHEEVPAEEEEEQSGLGTVKRVARLPLVGSAFNLTNGVYGKIKESNLVVKLMLGTAEHTVQKAVEYVQPFATPFEKPIKTVDSMVCNTFDAVEAKIPAIKKSTSQVYAATAGRLPIEPVLEHAMAAKNFGIQKVNDLRGSIQENLQNSSSNNGSLTDGIAAHALAAKNFGIQKVNDLRGSIQENIYSGTSSNDSATTTTNHGGQDKSTQTRV